MLKQETGFLSDGKGGNLNIIGHSAGCSSCLKEAGSGKDRDGTRLRMASVWTYPESANPEGTYKY